MSNKPTATEPSTWPTEETRTQAVVRLLREGGPMTGAELQAAGLLDAACRANTRGSVERSRGPRVAQDVFLVASVADWDWDAAVEALAGAPCTKTQAAHRLREATDDRITVAMAQDLGMVEVAWGRTPLVRLAPGVHPRLGRPPRAHWTLVHYVAIAIVAVWIVTMAVSVCIGITY